MRWDRPQSKTYLCIMLRDDAKSWRDLWFNVKRGTTLKSFKYDGQSYNFDPSKSYLLIRWNVKRSDSYLGILYNAFSKAIPTIIYQKGDPDPQDRIVRHDAEIEVNPRLLKVLTSSKLLNEYLRSLRFGATVNLTTVLFIFGGLGVLLAILYFGGYL